MSSIQKLDEISSELANCLLANIQTKQLFKKKILELVVSSCKVYGEDKVFQHEIEKLDRNLKSQK